MHELCARGEESRAGSAPRYYPEAWLHAAGGCQELSAYAPATMRPGDVQVTLPVHAVVDERATIRSLAVALAGCMHQCPSHDLTELVDVDQRSGTAVWIVFIADEPGANKRISHHALFTSGELIELDIDIGLEAAHVEADHAASSRISSSLMAWMRLRAASASRLRCWDRYSAATARSDSRASFQEVCVE